MIIKRVDDSVIGEWSSVEEARLMGADLTGANLSGAYLAGAYLSGAYLSGADLSGANLSRADLSGANLTGAYLTGACLTGACLTGAKNVPAAVVAMTSIAPEGVLTGWKKCRNGVIVRLGIPSDAKRSNATTNKCRAEYTAVREVIGGEVGVSIYDGVTEYRVGDTVRCHAWDGDRWTECGGGIHFFMTRKEAEDYA